jgi:hypothetical protein
MYCMGAGRMSYDSLNTEIMNNLLHFSLRALVVAGFLDVQFLV